MLVSKSLTGGVQPFSLSSSSPCISQLRRMRYTMRLMFLPFSLAGCGSNSSVAVGNNQSRDTKESTLTRIEGTEQSKSVVKSKPLSASLVLPRPSIAARMQRFFGGIKNISKIFVYKEEEEREMEIGFPTDVKHVTHIGLDGLTTNNIVNILAQTTHMPTISVDDYEMAMAAQAQPPLPISLIN